MIKSVSIIAFLFSIDLIKQNWTDEFENNHDRDSVLALIWPELANRDSIEGMWSLCSEAKPIRRSSPI